MPRLTSISTLSLTGLGLSRGVATLINGDFAEGFTGWLVNGFDTAQTTGGQATLSSAVSGTLSQGLGVTPNLDYVIALDVIAQTGGGSTSLLVSSATDGNLVVESLENTAGSTQVFAFNTQDNAVTLTITVANGDSITIDNVSIEPINAYFAYSYPLTNTNTDPTSTVWKNSFAPADTYFFANLGVYTQQPITDTTDMFLNSSINDSDITTWDTGSFAVTDSMFAGAAQFNQDIGSWNMSSVTDSSSMFVNATAFNQDISGWDMSNVTLLNNMFNNADAFDQDISSWDTGSVITATDFSTNAQQKELGNWTELEHPRIAIRSASGTALSSFGSSTTSVTLEDEAVDLPAFPFRIYGEVTQTTAEVNSTSTAGFGETILNFSNSVPNTWQFGERVTVIVSSV